MAKLTAGAVIVDRDGVLVVRHAACGMRRAAGCALMSGCWDVVGGHVEAGEMVEEALAREVEEGTGWALLAIRGDLGEHRWFGDGSS